MEFKVNGRKKIPEILIVFATRDSHAPPLPRDLMGSSKLFIYALFCCNLGLWGIAAVEVEGGLDVQI